MVRRPKRWIAACFLLLLAAVLAAFYFHGKAAVKQTAAEMPEKTARLIILRHTADGAAEQIPLEDALVGFLAGEMSAEAPEAALQAQAVAGRSYVYARNLSAGEVCDDSAHCLAYLSEEERRKRWGRHFAKYEEKLKAAVAATADLMLLSDGEVQAAYFHAVCGGMTENAADCWGGSVQTAAVPCFWDGGAAGNISASFWPKAELAAKLGVTEEELALLTVRTTSASGRVQRLSCGAKSWRGSEFRSLLGLRSADFNWLATAEGYWFTVQGYGHGVGMCQAGAIGLAEQGSDFNEILAYYYPDFSVGSPE